MNNYTFSVPQNIIFGEKCLERLPELLKKNKFKKIFIMSGHNLERLGIVKRIEESLQSNGMKTFAFLDILPNPTIEMVDSAKKSYQEFGGDCIIALGGGSPMDAAKAVGILARYGGSIIDYEGANQVPGSIEPIIAIPTTAGTGSEVSPFSVITDTSRNYKLSVFSHEILPAYALLDPEMIMTTPASVAASCGIDALIHAMEAYISLWSNPFTDALAEKAMDLIGANIRRFVANRRDLQAASAMLQGSMFAGMAISYARTGDVHALSHPVSAFFHVPHGVANAILLPSVLEFNALADQGRYEKIYNYINENRKPASDFQTEMLVREIRQLNNILGIPKSLSAVGVSEDKINAMAQDALKSGNIQVNPRNTELEDLIDMYKKSMY